MEMDSRKNMIVVAVVIIVALVVLALIIFRKPADTNCELSDSQPVFNQSLVPNVASKDNKALANFFGYLEYNIPGDKRNIMVLNLSSVDWLKETSDDGKGEVRFTLIADCATLDLTLKMVLKDQINSYQAQNIEVNLEKPNGNHWSCRVKNPTYITFPDYAHFSCKQSLKFDCFTNDTQEYKVALLNILDLEFEFDGDSKKIEYLDFSQPSYVGPWCHAVRNLHALS